MTLISPYDRLTVKSQAHEVYAFALDAISYFCEHFKCPQIFIQIFAYLRYI